MLTSVMDAVEGSSGNPVVTLCALMMVIALFLVIRRRRNNQISLGKLTNGLARPPCLPSLPVIGSSPFIVKTFDDLVGSNMMKTLPAYFLQTSKELGDVFAFYSMSEYTVVLNGRKAIHEAFVKKATDFADRKPFVIEKTVSNQRLKGIIACPFSDGVIKRRSETLSMLRDAGYGGRGMEFHIQQQLVNLVEQTSKFHDKPFDPASMIYNCVTAVIIGLVFGRQIEANDPLIDRLKVFSDYLVDAGAPVFDMVPLMRLLPRFRQLRKSVADSSEKLFRQLKDEANDCLTNGRQESFTYIYANKYGRESVYQEEFLYIVRDLLLAGSETSQSTIRWMLKLLANNNDVQKRLHEEVDELFGTSQRLPSLDDVTKLPLVTATILETMRIETLVPFSAIHRTLCDTEVCGYFIPKGTPVFPNLYSAHMDPDEWENVNDFQPERFLGSDGKVVGQERVIPFSMGKRVCLGEQLARAELFIFLTGLMRQFHVLPPEGQSCISTERVCGSTVQPTSYKIRMMRRDEIIGNYE